MGLPDTYDIMWQCDRWLLLGAPRVIPNQLYKAVEEQGWQHDTFLPELLERWHLWTAWQSSLNESAAFHRGYGWRVWHTDGEERTSLTHLWKDVPDHIGLGVVYLGTARRMLQGKDPFYLEGGLPRACKVADVMPTARPVELSQPKAGVWASDQCMADWRRSAVFAFGLE